MNLGKIWRLNDSIQESETRIIGPTTFPLQKRANWNQECQKTLIFQVRKLFRPGASHVNVNHARFWCTFFFSEVYSYHTYLVHGEHFRMEIHEAVEAGPLANTCGTPELGSCKKEQVVLYPAGLLKCRVPKSNAMQYIIIIILFT